MAPNLVMTKARTVNITEQLPPPELFLSSILTESPIL